MTDIRWETAETPDEGSITTVKTCEDKESKMRETFRMVRFTRKSNCVTSSDPHHDISIRQIVRHVLKHFGIFSGISSHIGSDILSGIVMHSFWHSVWHIFWHSFWHFVDIISYISSGISSDTLLTFHLAYLLTLSYILSGFRLSGISCGGEHCRPVLAVEVRQGTLPSGAGRWGLSDIVSGTFSDLSSDILSDTLAGISSEILSDILFGISYDIISEIISVTSLDILCGISSDILSGISSSDILFGLSSDTLSGVQSGIHIFWLAVEVRRGTSVRSWRLRSGGEHCHRELAVEVRRRTLPSNTCGWGGEEEEQAGREAADIKT